MDHIALTFDKLGPGQFNLAPGDDDDYDSDIDDGHVIQKRMQWSASSDAESSVLNYALPAAEDRTN